MKFTNRFGLPSPIVRAVCNDGYSKGDADYSVTQLLKPPRIVALERAHWDEIEEDASDRIWALLGQATHVIAERANEVEVAERRLAIAVDGIIVSGGMDLYLSSTQTLLDYKVTSVWKAKMGIPPEWEQQLNLYAQILRQNGHPVKQLQVLAIFRDWSKLEARRDGTYPQAQSMMFTIPLWESEKALSFLKERIALHEAAKFVLPECTGEDRWAKADVYAVMKEGRKSAVKLHDSEESASKHVMELGANHYIQKRHGMNTRCEAYCNVAKFCDLFKRLKGDDNE